MTRLVPPHRFRQLLEAAAQAFIRRGYQQTQMTDIATALGVAKGTLYAYVESKDALFDIVLRFADQAKELPNPANLPVRTPKRGATVKYVRERLATEVSEMALFRVIQGSLVIENPTEELKIVLGDLYDRLTRNRYAIKLIDRCAVDYPELAEVWFGDGRRAQVQMLATLLQQRRDEGRLKACENVDVAARLLLETVVFWAVHRHFDPSPQPVDDEAARRAVIEMLARSVGRARR